MEAKMGCTAWRRDRVYGQRTYIGEQQQHDNHQGAGHPSLASMIENSLIVINIIVDYYS
jgi:hypothetical protein